MPTDEDEEVLGVELEACVGAEWGADFLAVVGGGHVREPDAAQRVAVGITDRLAEREAEELADLFGEGDVVAVRRRRPTDPVDEVAEGRPNHGLKAGGVLRRRVRERKD